MEFSDEMFMIDIFLSIRKSYEFIDFKIRQFLFLIGCCYKLQKEKPNNVFGKFVVNCEVVTLYHDHYKNL